MGVDDGDVEKRPEEVFPPASASAPNTVVGAHLVEPVDAFHQHVVLEYTGRHTRVNLLVLAERFLMTSPLASFVDGTHLSCHLHPCAPASFVLFTDSLLEDRERHRVREFAPSCARRTAQVGICLRQVFCQVYGGAKVVRKHVVVAQKMVPQQFYRDAIPQIEVDRRISLGACVYVERHAVSRVRVRQAPQFSALLCWLLGHVLLERQSTVEGDRRDHRLRGQATARTHAEMSVCSCR